MKAYIYTISFLTFLELIGQVIYTNRPDVERIIITLIDLVILFWGFYLLFKI